MNSDPFRLAQQGSSQENNVMKTTNLYKGAVAFPLFLASMDSQDDLQVSVVASYQSNVKNMVESSLTSVKSFAGNSITYTYEKEETQIGDCSYTRAIRLIKVVSTFGETAEIVYKDKEAFECIWPHYSKSSKNDFG
ncbi:hypothetical protein Dred_0860 [Desulforamulus reducens MI-1]|uniref:Uncharacterized protein n=1 Tax=Desulforamulus reducens (strain ATCC BAA-1160 / DSM 100696 / MI-1) TaxID=349161 RepID=A4J2U5_DESRM|nr:hypothetical protein [Desulforamulus reducens]ABO49398.1 hypothetical protein Dred_0860 [Desulforamulus reducens MI-1]